MAKKAIVLLSGGLDSTTTLYVALKEGYKPSAIIFDYKQRHKKEIQSAVRIARKVQCSYKILKIALPWQGSALLDTSKKIPFHKKIDTQKIPPTYVPGRNIIFLSFALSYAEAIGAQTIFIGANAIDYSGYPDCRPEFFTAFEKVISVGTKTGVERKRISIHAPLLFKTKAQIIRLGIKLGVPYHLTWSCYNGRSQPCGRCDSCRLRQKGFEEAGIPDPLLKK